MIQQFFLALVLAGLTVMLHAVGTIYVVMPPADVRLCRTDAVTSPRLVWMLTRLISLLLILHFVEMGVWAAAYSLANIFPDFETSLYYSLKSFTTVGYGDVLPAAKWRLLGPIEAAVGVLMLGWSTGIIVAAVQRIYYARLPSSSETS